MKREAFIVRSVVVSITAILFPIFAIAGDDKKFAWAKPVIRGDTITVSSPDVAKPVAVRFAWSNNPRATLHNGAGLPASLFRIDDYEK